MTETTTASDFAQGEEASARPKLQALDIAELLQERLVFLSGALDDNGNAIISIPDSSKFNKASDQDREKLFNYLVSLASAPIEKQGFVIVLDRRKAKWNNVKTALLQIEQCFPSSHSISCVYLLKPQGFLQKYSQPGFVNYKMQVLTLDSTSELYKYITKDQLTTDFGGHLLFSSTEWVQHRTAIERFELNTVTYDKRLQTLKDTFSKTNIPTNIEEIHTMVQLQEEMWNDVREDISSAIEAGMTLRSCIYPKNSGDRNRPVPPDVQANTGHMDRILKELDTLTMNFEKFWLGHKSKIQQGLQLCYFEQEAGQVTGQLMTAVGNVSGTSDMGDTRSTAESLIEELKQLHAKVVQEGVQKAKALVSKGQKMMEDTHYAVEAIRHRCKELEKLCDDFEKAVQKREENLKKAMDIHQCLEQVTKWCNTGVDLLASQPVDRFQSSEGAEKALEEIDNFLKTPQGINLGKLNKMEKTSKELQNKFLAYRVKDTLKRIGEVNEMMRKREGSLKKLVVKRPVQPVAAITVTSSQERRRSTPNTPPVGDKSRGKMKVNAGEKRRPVSIVLSPDTPPLSPNLSLSKARCKSVPNLMNADNVDSDPNVLKKTEQVVTELIATEKDYVADLECIIQGYLNEFDSAGSKIPQELYNQKHVVFGNIKQIYKFHKKVFLSELKACAGQPLQIGNVFIGKLEEFEMYATYCKNKPSTEDLRAEYLNLPFFKECQMKLGHKLPLHSYLLKPVQRITKYQLLLREMMKYSHPQSIAYQDLREAYEKMEDVLRHVNDVMHSCGIKGYRGSLSALGKLCLQDSFLVWHSSRKGLPPLKGRQRQVFLYQSMVIFSKKEEENSKEKVYHYKSSMKMSDVGLTETVKGDACKFELWLKGRTEVFVLQAISEGVKARWVTSIRNLLQSQFDMYKGKTGKSASCTHLNSIPSPEFKRPATRMHSELSETSEQDRLSNRDEDVSDDDFDSDEWSDDEDDDAEPGSALTQTVYTETSYEGMQYIAVASYTALEETEVSFVEGDILGVLRVGQNGWWFARHTTTLREGWVPASYLELHVSGN